MYARLTQEVIVKYPQEKKKNRVFLQQTNSFCVTPSDEDEGKKEERKGR
jgi:hypothetical protein